jgi:MYXO-CTERM domain-containing protein
VRWDVPGLPTATIDYNGYYPDGQFEFGYGGSGMTYANLAAVIAGGMFDVHSMLVPANDIGVVGPADYTVKVDPIAPFPHPGSLALDHATPLPNIDDEAMGAGPDLGALEAGCAAPEYGPRAFGDETTDQPCGAPIGPDDGGFGGDDPGTNPGGKSGCGCGAAATPDAIVWCAVVGVLGFARRRRRSDGNDLSLRG